jgi:hypothetical protein
VAGNQAARLGNEAGTRSFRETFCVMGGFTDNEEDRSVEQILDELAPLRSCKRATLNRPWTLVLRAVVIVALVLVFAIWCQ